ncbi:Vacuolar protein sorting-associated protein 54 [Portunus trituberculatus]|uniref:Vacuolar protein sorting-associated protein 54 n=1 Tax=Portunus trituberculatus TaxID=210409 RepID=A0A5B7HY77_PORTR|nr:Vacuolar protein sorting-associated protein 54 [Portunus trituberculatus]
MSDTLERQLSTWEARSPVPSPSFSGILKALSKLHEAVSDVLPPQQMLVVPVTYKNVLDLQQQPCQFVTPREYFASPGRAVESQDRMIH